MKALYNLPRSFAGERDGALRYFLRKMGEAHPNQSLFCRSIFDGLRNCDTQSTALLGAVTSRRGTVCFLDNVVVYPFRDQQPRLVE